MPAAESFDLEVIHHLLAAAAEEMGACLQRSAFSTNIKERRDYSCAVFDARGRMLAQAAHIPVHLGSMGPCTQAVLEDLALEPDDCALLNDPYRGGTHLPDLTLVAPVFLPGERRASFHVANRAHHADVGGPVPGSMAPARDVHGEGLRLPPVLLVRRGRLQRDVLRVVLANMRLPREREGDLLAQLAANRHGRSRLEALAREFGAAALRRSGEALLSATAALARAWVRSLPRRAFRFADQLDGPAEQGHSAVLRCRLVRDHGGLLVDWSETDDAVPGGVATVRAVTLSAVFYVLRAMLGPDAPTSDGLWRVVRVRTRTGSLVDARYPCAVAAGNVETSQRLVDCLLGALARALPGRIPAASAGTMANLTFGGTAADGRAFTYYETNPGGAGASPRVRGASALQTHMTNTRNTPIETLETSVPVRVLGLAVRRGSGGSGARRGGDGLAKRLLFLEPARVTWVAERVRRGPWGLAGGGAGAPARARVRVPRERGRARELGAAASLEVPAGSVLELLTPGGGGHGRAR